MAFTFTEGAAAAPVNWSEDVLYFVLLDRFADGDTSNNNRVERRNPGGYHGGDLKGLTQQLDELSDLGVTALWINPIQKQMSTSMYAQAPAKLGIPEFAHWGFHGYWIEDFEAIEPQFGTRDDLKALVEEAHKRGIKVLLDVVYNHSAYQSPYRHRQTSTGQPWQRLGEGNCEVDAVTCAVGGLPDFRTEEPEVRDFVLKANLDLARFAGVDGFRLDTYKHLASDFWLEHRKQTRALNKDFFLLAEYWGATNESMDPYFERDEIDSAFDFTFKGSCEGFVMGRGRAVAFGGYLKKRHKIRPGYLMAHYLSSHDEPMSLANLGRDKEKFQMCVALQMTSLGMPVIYYGEEVARGGSEWPTNRNDMPWGKRDIRPGIGIERDEAMRSYYKQLIALRKQHKALTRGDFTLVSGPQDAGVAFVRHDGTAGDSVLVLANRDAQAIEMEVTLPSQWGAPTLTDALGKDVIAITESKARIRVAPKTVRIFVPGGTP